MNRIEAFKEKFDICLEEIKKQGLKINGMTSLRDDIDSIDNTCKGLKKGNKEYIITIHDHSGIYLDKLQMYYAMGTSEYNVKKDVFSRLCDSEIDAYDISVILKEDIPSLTDLEIVD